MKKAYISSSILAALATLLVLFSADFSIEIYFLLGFVLVILLGQLFTQMMRRFSQKIDPKIAREESDENEAIAHTDDDATGWLINSDAFEEGIIVTCGENNVSYINVAAKQLLSDLDQNNLFDQQNISHTFEMLHSLIVDRQGADQVVEAILATPSLKFSERLHFKDGKTIERSTRPVGDHGERIWILRDISHLEQANEERHLHDRMIEEDAARTAEMAEQLYLAKSELEEKQAELTRLANTDMLTNVPNRRHFMNVASEAFSSVKPPFEIWALMLDIDFFKRVNDTYGHAAGDAVIIEFARIIDDTIGSHGTMGRMGGEEFAVVLPGVTQQEAEKFAETIRAEAEQNAVIHEGQTITYTTSIGLAKAEPGDKSVEIALDHADAALYEAKQSGRNKSKLYVSEVRLQA